MRRRKTPVLAHLYVPALAAALLAGGWAPPARALDAIEFEARELTMAGMKVSGVRVRLDLLDERRTRLAVNAAAMPMPDPVGVLSNLALVCDAPVIAEPRYACDAG